jgi:hypothetical protein
MRVVIAHKPMEGIKVKTSEITRLKIGSKIPPKITKMKSLAA